MEQIVALVACCALLAAGASVWCGVAVVPLRARIAQLELERPRFLAELQGMFEACEESLARADAKRKRADNSLRAATAATEGETPTASPQPLPFRRGTVIERLP
jgi:hypothetical protein